MRRTSLAALALAPLAFVACTAGSVSPTAVISTPSKASASPTSAIKTSSSTPKRHGVVVYTDHFSTSRHTSGASTFYSGNYRLSLWNKSPRPLIVNRVDCVLRDASGVALMKDSYPVLVRLLPMDPKDAPSVTYDTTSDGPGPTDTRTRPKTIDCTAARVSTWPIPIAHGVSVHVPHPSGIVGAFGSIWVESDSGNWIWRIAPTGRVLARIQVAPAGRHDRGFEAAVWGYRRLISGMGSIWTLWKRTLFRIDPSTDRIVSRTKVPFGYESLAAGAGALWLTGNSGNLVRLDPATGETSMVVLGESAASFTTEGGYVWMGFITEAGGGMIRYDPRTKQSLEFEASTNDTIMLGAFGRVWLTHPRRFAALGGFTSPAFNDGRYVHYQCRTCQGITAITSGLGRIWMNAGRLIEVDPSTGHATALPGVPSAFRQRNAGIAVLGSRVWMVDTVRDRVVGIEVSVPSTGGA